MIKKDALTKYIFMLAITSFQTSARPHIVLINIYMDHTCM